MCARVASPTWSAGPSTSPLGVPVDQYSAPISRPVAVAVGIVVTVMGLALVSLVGLGVFRTLSGGLPSSSVLIILGVVGALGVALCVVGLRLVSGRRRRDGGLFSPWVLRFGGIIFFLGPVVIMVSRSWSKLFEAGLCLSAGVGCFALANRGQQTPADSGTPNNRWRGRRVV